MATYTQTNGNLDGRKYFMDVEISPATLASGALAQRFDAHRYPRVGTTAVENRGLVKATTTVVTASSVTPAAAASVTLTATVTVAAGGTFGASGTITFKDGATTLGTGVLSNGVATLVVSAGFTAGVHNVTATYPGTTYTVTSTSAARVITATP